MEGAFERNSPDTARPEAPLRPAAERSPAREFRPEVLETLPPAPEDGAFFRSLPADAALDGVLGSLRLEADRQDDALGSRDNAAVSLHDAIYFGPTQRTRDGKKFLCAINFDPEPGTLVMESRLGRATNRRITGPVKVKEVILRFAGDKPGKPGPVEYLSPRDFYQWYFGAVAPGEN